MDSAPDQRDLTAPKDGDHPTTGLTPPGTTRHHPPPARPSIPARGQWRCRDFSVPQNRVKKSGIYYLVDYRDEGVVVLYIGATKNIEKRIARHVRDQQIRFCDVYFDPCEESELEEREAAAIAEFRPVSLGKNMPR